MIGKESQHHGQEHSDMAPLRELRDWQVAEGDPDIRGWEVVDTEEHKVGQIEDLIIDRRTGEASFAQIGYGGNLGIGEKHTLIPIDELRLDPGAKRVISRYPLDSMRSAPEFREDTRDFGSFSGFWAGLAAAGVGRPREPVEREEQRGGFVQRFVQRMEGGREPEHPVEATAPVEREGEFVKRVRVHLAHRLRGGDETPLSEGDVIEIPVTQRGESRRSVIDEIVIRLEALEEDEEPHRRAA